MADEQSTEISFNYAKKVIPKSLLNFMTMLLCEKKPDIDESGQMMSDQATTEKALIAAQQLLQHMTGVPTPLGIVTAYDVFKQTRSKSLITLNNRLGQGISYDRLHR